MASKAEVKKSLGKLIAAFQYVPKNLDATIDIYTEALEDVPDEALRIAVSDWIAAEKWFPKIAELRSKARTGKAGHWRKEPRPESEPGLSSPVIDQKFSRAIQHFEWIKPEQWKSEDHALFESIMGRPVDFKNDPPNAPWMWWKPQ